MILGKWFHLSSATLTSKRANSFLVSQGHYKQESNSGNKIFEAQIRRHKRLTSALILSLLEGRFRITYALCLTAVNNRKTIVWADFSCSYSVWVKLISLYFLINEDSLHSSNAVVSAESFHRRERQDDGKRHQFVFLVCSIPLPEELTLLISHQISWRLTFRLGKFHRLFDENMCSISFVNVFKPEAALQICMLPWTGT